MNTYLVLYCMPNTGLRAWMQKPEAERKAEEDKMKALWQMWMQTHGSSIKETAGAGKTTRVTAGGSSEMGNDVMMYSLVTAESKEAASAMFIDHPHLQIPGSWIDVMQANKIGM